MAMLEQLVRPDHRATLSTSSPAGYLDYHISPTMQRVFEPFMPYHHRRHVPDRGHVHHDHRHGLGHARPLGRHVGLVVDSVAVPSQAR